MAQRQLESIAQLRTRLETRFERGFSGSFWMYWLLLVVLPHAILGFLIIGVLAGYLTEPSWITQRWPYPPPKP